MDNEKRIFIVEDDFLIVDYLTVLCEDLGFCVVGSAADAEAALEGIRRDWPPYVLMDVRLHGTVDGVDVAIALHAERPETRIIFVTGSNEPPTVARIRTDHPHDILIKPVSPQALEAALS